jgi:hypothetical protein
LLSSSHLQRDIKQASSAKVPDVGFFKFAVGFGDLVIVYAGGDAGKGLLAYRIQSGEMVSEVSTNNYGWTAGPSGIQKILNRNSRILCVLLTRCEQAFEICLPVMAMQ